MAVFDPVSKKFFCQCGCGQEVNFPFCDFKRGHGSRCRSKEVLERISNSVREWWADPENHERGSQTNRDRWTGEERELAAERSRDSYINDPGLYSGRVEQLRQATGKRWSRLEAHLEASEITSRSAKEVWDGYTPEEKLARLRNSVHSPESLRASHEKTRRGFSEVERELYGFLEEDFPGEFVWNKDKEKCIGGKFPDLYSDEFRLVIECFGEPWHNGPDDEEVKVEHYKGYGWDCIVVWANKLLDIALQYCEVKDKIDFLIKSGSSLRMKGMWDAKIPSPLFLLVSEVK